jgi:hypothetical protein
MFAGRPEKRPAVTTVSVPRACSRHEAPKTEAARDSMTMLTVRLFE